MEQTARLRYVSAKDPDDISAFVEQAGPRIAFGYSPVFVEKEGRWYYWYVVRENLEDVPSLKL